jgi:hypothetical protein
MSSLDRLTALANGLAYSDSALRPYEESKYQAGRTPNGYPTTVAVPGLPYFTPLTLPKPGTYLEPTKEKPNAQRPKFLEPLKIRGVEFKNRIFLSPMAQYSSQPGIFFT